MKTIQEAFDAAIDGLPSQFTTQLIEKKLKEDRIKLSRKKIKKFVTALLNGDDNLVYFQWWKWWDRRQITIQITEEDMKEVERQFGQFSERLADIIQGLISELQPVVLTSLKRHWPAEARRERRTNAAFKKRLERRWGDGLDLLRLLLKISIEVGAAINTDLRETAAQHNDYAFGVLTRSHARACQVTEEILTLLEAGFADGALARWRTLHEIAVTALFVHEHGNELAERYILHQFIETRRGAIEYQSIKNG